MMFPTFTYFPVFPFGAAALFSCIIMAFILAPLYGRWLIGVIVITLFAAQWLISGGTARIILIIGWAILGFSCMMYFAWVTSRWNDRDKHRRFR